MMPSLLSTLDQAAYVPARPPPSQVDASDTQGTSTNVQAHLGHERHSQTPTGLAGGTIEFATHRPTDLAGIFRFASVPYFARRGLCRITRHFDGQPNNQREEQKVNG